MNHEKNTFYTPISAIGCGITGATIPAAITLVHHIIRKTVIVKIVAAEGGSRIVDITPVVLEN